jgi:hypothetical protein
MAVANEAAAVAGWAEAATACVECAGAAREVLAGALRAAREGAVGGDVSRSGGLAYEPEVTGAAGGNSERSCSESSGSWMSSAGGADCV